MICDKFENIGLYCNQGDALYKAISYARDFDISLSDGEYELDGRNIFAKVVTYKTEKADLRKFEAHKEYIDVQVMLSGKERMDVSIDQDLELIGDYDKENDFQLLEPKDGYSTMVMSPGKFVIFFPDDIHRPNCNIETYSTSARKICIKVKK